MKNLQIKNNGDDTYFVSYEKVHKIEGKETILTVEFPKVDISFGNHEFLCSREGFTKSLELLVDMVAYPGGKNNVICNLIRQTENKGGLSMDKVVLPREVANAIEKIWDKFNINSIAVKHFALTNWMFLDLNCPNEYLIVLEYAKKNPIQYMKALVEGYDIEESPEEELTRLRKENRDMRTEFKLLNMLDIDDITNKDYTDRDKLFQVMEYVHEASSKY